MSDDETTNNVTPITPNAMLSKLQAALVHPQSPLAYNLLAGIDVLEQNGHTYVVSPTPSHEEIQRLRTGTAPRAPGENTPRAVSKPAPPPAADASAAPGKKSLIDIFADDLDALEQPAPSASSPSSSTELDLIDLFASDLP